MAVHNADPQRSSSSGPTGPPPNPRESQLSEQLRARATHVKDGMQELTTAAEVLAGETRSINSEATRYSNKVSDIALAVGGFPPMEESTDGEPQAPLARTPQQAGPGHARVGNATISVGRQEPPGANSLGNSPALYMNIVLGMVLAIVALVGGVLSPEQEEAIKYLILGFFLLGPIAVGWLIRKINIERNR